MYDIFKATVNVFVQILKKRIRAIPRPVVQTPFVKKLTTERFANVCLAWKAFRRV